MRESANLTQRELAKRLGINHTMVHNSDIAERRVDLAEFIDWATACGLDPVEAFREFLKRRQ
jgi:transcriptional regulator with XRE-family HTH domain